MTVTKGSELAASGKWEVVNPLIPPMEPFADTPPIGNEPLAAPVIDETRPVLPGPTTGASSAGTGRSQKAVRRRLMATGHRPNVQGMAVHFVLFSWPCKLVLLPTQHSDSESSTRSSTSVEVVLVQAIPCVHFLSFLSRRSAQEDHADRAQVIIRACAEDYHNPTQSNASQKHSWLCRDVRTKA